MSDDIEKTPIEETGNNSSNNSEQAAPNNQNQSEAMVPQRTTQGSNQDNKWLITLLLCIFLGSLGLHRFYNGKIGTGILMIITIGGCGIWTIIDLIMIVLGRFTDSDGNIIERA